MSTPYENEPPTDQLIASMRSAMRNNAADFVHYGVGKVKRVRVEVEFGCGETLVFEVVNPPKP